MKELQKQSQVEMISLTGKQTQAVVVVVNL